MDLKELASKAIKGELDLTFEHHPVHSFVDGSTEIQDNLLAFKGIAGFYVLDTGSGLVMLDAGHIIDIERAYEEIRKWRPNEPLVAAIFTHHHVDHIFAVEKFDEEAISNGNEKPTVYANKLMPEHFDRYLKTLGWNTAINKRQFAINVQLQVCCQLKSLAFLTTGYHITNRSSQEFLHALLLFYLSTMMLMNHAPMSAIKNRN